MDANSPETHGIVRIPTRRAIVIGFGAIAPLALPEPSSPQSVAVELFATQSLTSIDGLGSPLGFGASLDGIALTPWLGLGGAGNRISESPSVIPGYCGAFSCFDGPFEESNTLTTLTFSLTTTVSHDDVDLTLGGGPLFAMQKRTLTYVESEAQASSTSTGNVGLEISSRLRLPPLAWRLRPLLRATYQRINGGACVADAACFGTRHVAGLGVGLSRALH